MASGLAQFDFDEDFREERRSYCRTPRSSHFTREVLSSGHLGAHYLCGFRRESMRVTFGLEKLSLRDDDDVNDDPYMLNPDGTLVCTNMECMMIGSFGDKYRGGMTVTRKLKTESDYLHNVSKDIQRVQQLIAADDNKTLRSDRIYTDDPERRRRTKEECLKYIEQFFKEVRAPGSLIWFSGHCQGQSGNWALYNGAITFEEVFLLYLEYFRGKLLYLVCDCCYAGKWIDACNRELYRRDISGARKTREAGVMIKIFTSCSGGEVAADGAFTHLTEEGGVINDGKHNWMSFLVGKTIEKWIRSDGKRKLNKQTVSCGDFTK